MNEVKIVKLKQKEDKTIESGFMVIERLEEALSMAKEGLIDNIFIVVVGTDKTVSRAWANDNEPFLMLGVIEDAKRDFMNTTIES